LRVALTVRAATAASRLGVGRYVVDMEPDHEQDVVDDDEREVTE
jgi:hypothetical protein